MKHCKSSRRTGRRHMRRKKQSFSLFYRSGLLSKEALLAQGETSGDRAWLRTSSVSGRIVGRRRRRNERKREFLSSERKRSEGEFFFCRLDFFLCVSLLLQKSHFLPSLPIPLTQHSTFQRATKHTTTMPALATSSAAAAAARCTLGSLLAARRAAVSSLPSPTRAMASRSMAATRALPRSSEPLLAPSSPLRRHEARRYGVTVTKRRCVECNGVRWLGQQGRVIREACGGDGQ